MTLEGWTNDVVNPILSRHPYAWLFFIPFIVITTFWVLNLFIGIIVNAMQEEHAKAEAEIIHDETCANRPRHPGELNTADNRRRHRQFNAAISIIRSVHRHHTPAPQAERPIPPAKSETLLGL